MVRFRCKFIHVLSLDIFTRKIESRHGTIREEKRRGRGTYACVYACSDYMYYSDSDAGVCVCICSKIVFYLKL